MIFEPETVKGFQDLLPPESLKRKKVKEIIEKHFSLYGFLPVETPSIELDELMRPESLASEQEDEAVSDRFRLKDKGGRNLGLRYEFTFQLSKIFKQNPNLKLPFKRYQIGSVFRDEPTGPNRFREITMCDADIIGSSGAESDAECLSLANDILKELGIKAEIAVNNRKLLNSIIESVKIQNKKEVMKELDKLDKIGEDTVKANLRKYADPNQILSLFKLLEKPIEFFKENLFEGADEIDKLQTISKSYGLKVKFSPFMIRGLGYYTGNIFELRIEGQKESIGGGGRYDKLVGKYSGKEIPAVGIAFGLDRITSLANINPESTKAIIISIEKDKEAIKLAQKIRSSSVPCIFIPEKPGKCLEYASSYQIPYAIFIGQEEVQKGKFKLRDMKTGEEKLLSDKQIISKLKK